MNLEPLRQAVLASARRHPPSDGVPYAFEQRIMARLRDAPLPAPSPWGQWTVGFWRAAISGGVFAALLVMTDGLIPESGAGTDGALSSLAIEETVMASSEPVEELW